MVMKLLSLLLRWVASIALSLLCVLLGVLIFLDHALSPAIDEHLEDAAAMIFPEKP